MNAPAGDSPKLGVSKLNKLLTRRNIILLVAGLLVVGMGFVLAINKKHKSTNKQTSSSTQKPLSIIVDANGKKTQVFDFNNEPNSGENQKGVQASIKDQIKKLESPSAQNSNVSAFGQSKEYVQQDRYIALAQLYYQSGYNSKALESLNKAKQYANKNSKYYASTIKYIDDFIKKLKS